ncbi:MAG: tRNA pseudouridine(55) synthase TruB [Gemmatimonadales bacterium]
MDKPAGPTSHDVVARVRRALKIRAVGHTGTLDPFATGLLVVLVGRATRLARFVEAEAKTYLATARLGTATDTDDLAGEAVREAPAGWNPAPAEFAACLAGFLGTSRQRPPAYSAKKVAGRRSYELARRGAAPELAEVEVTVHAIDLVEFAGDQVVFRATVSAGTYLRAIARDLGERLGGAAHLVALRREAIGSLRVEDAVPLDAIGPATALLPPQAVLPGWPVRELSEKELIAVRHGRAVEGALKDSLTVAGGQGGRLLLVHAGHLAAVAESDGGQLRPVVVLEAAG